MERKENTKREINLCACQDRPVYVRVKIKPTILQFIVGLGLSLAGNNFIGSFHLVLLIFSLHGAKYTTVRKGGELYEGFVPRVIG